MSQVRPFLYAAGAAGAMGGMAGIGSMSLGNQVLAGGVIGASAGATGGFTQGALTGATSGLGVYDSLRMGGYGAISGAAIGGAVGMAAPVVGAGLRVAGRGIARGARGMGRGLRNLGRETSSGSWTARPGGIRYKRVGNYWVKEVDPNASGFMRAWGRSAIRAQAKALDKLGDMAPSHLLRNGRLVTRDVGSYSGGNFLKTWAKGSWRMRTIFNDIRPRNIGGPQNMIFDPALPPAQQWAYRGIAAGGVALLGYYEYLRRQV